MGHGSSLPSEYKQKIHAAFQIKNTEAWRNAEDFEDELEMRNELMNLRALAAYRPHLDNAEALALTLHLLRATSTNEHLAAYAGHARVDFGWAACGFVPSKVLLYLYEGDHYGVVSVKALPRLCDSLRPLLSRLADELAGVANYHMAFVEEVEALLKRLPPIQRARAIQKMKDSVDTK